MSVDRIFYEVKAIRLFFSYSLRLFFYLITTVQKQKHFRICCRVLLMQTDCV